MTLYKCMHKAFRKWITTTSYLYFCFNLIDIFCNFLLQRHGIGRSLFEQRICILIYSFYIIWFEKLCLSLDRHFCRGYGRFCKSSKNIQKLWIAFNRKLDYRTFSVVWCHYILIYSGVGLIWTDQNYLIVLQFYFELEQTSAFWVALSFRTCVKLKCFSLWIDFYV